MAFNDILSNHPLNTNEQYCVSIEFRRFIEADQIVDYLTGYTLYEHYFDNLNDAQKAMQSLDVKPFGTIALYLHGKYPNVTSIDDDTRLEHIYEGGDTTIDLDVLPIWYEED